MRSSIETAGNSPQPVFMIDASPREAEKDPTRGGRPMMSRETGSGRSGSFQGAHSIVLVGHIVLQGRQQEGSELATLPIDTLQIVLREPRNMNSSLKTNAA